MPSRLVPAWNTVTPGMRRGAIEPADHAALLVAARIAVGRHHDDERRLVVPAKVEMFQAALCAGDQGWQQIGFQARHQHLAFGIAEADVEFDQLRARLPIISPAKSTPRNGAPRAAIAATVGSDDLAP